MIASRVTPPVEEEGATVDGAKGVEVAVNPDHLDRSCTLLRLTILASIAPMKRKGSEKGKGKRNIKMALKPRDS